MYKEAHQVYLDVYEEEKNTADKSTWEKLDLLSPQLMLWKDLQKMMVVFNFIFIIVVVMLNRKKEEEASWKFSLFLA